LLRNIGTQSGFIKGRRCCETLKTNWTMVFQFKNGEIMALTKTSMETASNRMKFIGRLLLFRLIFAGTAHRSQGMTLQRAILDCCMKFWEHGQLYMALSGVKSSGSLCILLPNDMDDFTILSAVDVDLARIVETMQSFRLLWIP
jgi:ATP-dependent exoDNAse (exonuclease V) alpha subunit